MQIKNLMSEDIITIDKDQNLSDNYHRQRSKSF